MEQPQNPYATPATNAHNPATDPPYEAPTLVQLLFSFDGRISRSPYWMGLLLLMGTVFVPLLFLSFLGAASEGAAGLVLALVGILMLLVTYCSWAVSAKRWHDRGKSGWWTLIQLIPFGSIWMLIECGFLPGEPGANQYGSDPKGPRA